MEYGIPNSKPCMCAGITALFVDVGGDVLAQDVFCTRHCLVSGTIAEQHTTGTRFLQLFI